MFVHIHVSENVSCKVHKQVSCISRCLTLVWLLFFSSCWCFDPKCLAGVEVCRGEKYSRQKLDRRYHHLALNLLSKNRHANRLSMEAQNPSLMTSVDIWKNVALSFLASGFLYINSECVRKFLQFGCKGRKRGWIPAGFLCRGKNFPRKTTVMPPK